MCKFRVKFWFWIEIYMLYLVIRGRFRSKFMVRYRFKVRFRFQDRYRVRF